MPTRVAYRSFLLEARVAGRRGDASDADIAVVRAQSAMRTGAIDWVALDASGSVDEVAGRIALELDRAGVG